MLTDIVHKFHRAGEKKNHSLEKTKEKHAKHIEEVMNKMEQSFLDEEERIF